ncbi:unnamed protein product [Meganyctiphanes norvegica]|uniref:Uncharacterized protein n=1 Tax=Meganyctiphanes norvegica TaxID=48144 RepID=A0AAV2SRS9_MEGNR
MHLVILPCASNLFNLDCCPEPFPAPEAPLENCGDNDPYFGCCSLLLYLDCCNKILFHGYYMNYLCSGCYCNYLLLIESCFLCLLFLYNHLTYKMHLHLSALQKNQDFFFDLQEISPKQMTFVHKLSHPLSYNRLQSIQVEFSYHLILLFSIRKILMLHLPFLGPYISHICDITCQIPSHIPSWYHWVF